MGDIIEKELVTSDMSRDALLDLVLDCLGVEPTTYEVSLSMARLSMRYEERTKLENQFLVTGGCFVELHKGEDPVLASFKTNISQTELTSKLIQNVQKDMSDKVFDVKIYELTLKSLPGAKKIRIEIFWVEEPDLVFRCDMFSSPQQDGSHIVIEKINIVE